MENPNTERKPLSDLVKEADEKKMQIVIIGAGETGTTVALAIANEHMMCVRIESLPESDQEKLAQAKRNRQFEPEPIQFTKLPELPEIKYDVVSAEKNIIFSGHKRKKLKGYQKKR